MGPLMRLFAAMRDWAELLVARARAEGVELTGDGGLLTGLVRQVLQCGLEVEMAEHLGYERNAVEGRGSGNSRNGTTPKTVTTEVGRVDLRVPRDRAGTFEPVTVPKHQRRLAAPAIGSHRGPSTPRSPRSRAGSICRRCRRMGPLMRRR